MTRLLAAVLFLLLAALAPPVRADGFTPSQRAEIVQVVRDALKQDPSILRDAVAALQADETARQDAAAAAAIAAHMPQLVTPADPVAGNPDGHVTIVEFFDTSCTYCRQMEPVMAALLARDHDVKLVFKDLPILGPASMLGASALIAAERQGGYVRLRDALMADPPGDDAAAIRAHAEALGLNWTEMQADMQDPAVQGRIAANIKLARTLGIQGTPGLIVGRVLLPGAVDLAELQASVAAARDAKE